MKKTLLTLSLIILSQSMLRAQNRYFEMGLGAKYDQFKIKQTEQVFENNFDLGGIAYFSYAQDLNNRNIGWEAGFATNNYKLNFKVKGQNDIIFSNRELVSVMRSNRLFLNVRHHSKQLSPKINWVNTFGISILIGAKNPYDVVLQRSKEIQTAKGVQSIDLTIKTFGKTGSLIMFGGSSRLYYAINKDFKMALQAGFYSGSTELSKVEITYISGSSSTYKKAIFSTNGFAPFLTLGIEYTMQRNIQ